MSINLAQGTIANMDLRHEIANVARFVTGAPKAERSTSVAALRGNFDVTNGLARTENLTASIEGGTLGATGTINLVDQTLNLRLTTVLSSEYSQRVGRSRVGGFMTTALANQQGELVGAAARHRHHGAAAVCAGRTTRRGNEGAKSPAQPEEPGKPDERHPRRDWRPGRTGEARGEGTRRSAGRCDAERGKTPPKPGSDSRRHSRKPTKPQPQDPGKQVERRVA